MGDDILGLVDSIANFLERRGDAHAIAEALAISASALRERRAGPRNDVTGTNARHEFCAFHLSIRSTQ